MSLSFRLKCEISYKYKLTKDVNVNIHRLLLLPMSQKVIGLDLYVYRPMMHTTYSIDIDSKRERDWKRWKYVDAGLSNLH